MKFTGDHGDGKKCPKCGEPMIDPTTIGLPKSGWGDLYCPMNMPYYGCGYSLRKNPKEKK